VLLLTSARSWAFHSIPRSPSWVCLRPNCWAISKEGVGIDPQRVSGIHEVPLPSTIKGIQSFPGRVNFVHRFTPNFVEIVKPITDMLKKGHDMIWREEGKKAFKSIK